MPGKTMMISLATGAALASAAAAYGYYRRSGGDDFYDDDPHGGPSGDGSSWTSRDLYGANNATAPASTTPRSSSFNEREDPYMPAGTSVSEGRNGNAVLKDKGGHT